MSIFKFKRKSEVVISWNLVNDMKPNIKNYNENYDKKLALKNFLIRNNFTLEQIDEILKCKNPFWEVFKHYKKIGTGARINDGRNVEEDTLYRYIRMTEIAIIENSKMEKAINLLFNAMTHSILYSAGYMYYTDGRGEPFSQFTYKEMLVRLENGEVVIEDIIMTAFHILFLASNREIEDFLNLFEWSWNNCVMSVVKQFATKIGGTKYLKGLFYKNIENSIKNHRTYNAKKIIDSNEINTLIDYDVHNILFSSNSNDNQVLFRECFEDFRNDLLNIRYFIKEANDLVYNKLFDYEINDNILFDSNNYFVNFKPYTNTGRKSKYPFNIEGAFVLSRKNELTVNLLYNRTGQVSRIEISMESSNIHRMIIIKEINNELILSEIKEHDIMVDAFPNVIYKYNE